MSEWETHAAAMDEAVDDRLGDTISLSLNGGSLYTSIKGFIIATGVGSGIEGFDEPLGVRMRAKIRKSIIGETEPNRDTVRLRSGKLGASTYQPAGSEPDDQGRYWLFDIQKV